MSKSPSLRRIQADIRELALDPSDRYSAAPLESDMFEWHFSIRGPPDTEFDGGLYHGRILLPPEYPFKPPHIIFLTPTGRFETHTKVCLSFSAYHPELWQPAWGIRLILEALISFLPTPADGAIGALDWSSSERKRLAVASQSYACPHCGPIKDLIPPLKCAPVKDGNEDSGKRSTNRFAKEIEELQRLQMMEHKKDEKESNEEVGKQNNQSSEKPASGNPVAKAPTETNQPAADSKGLSTDSTSQDDPPALTADVVAAAVAAATAEIQREKQAEQQENGSSSNGAMIADGGEANEEQDEEKPQNAMAATAMNTNNNNNVLPARVPGEVLDARVTVANAIPDVTESASDAGWQWLVDPVLQLAIVILSIICYLLLRKVQALVEELEELE